METPEAREKRLAYLREYRQHPEVKERNREYQHAYYLRKKAEREAAKNAENAEIAEKGQC